MKGGSFEINFQADNRKHKTVPGKFRYKKTVTAKILRSCPFQIFDVVGMIHDTSGIGILIIYSDVH
jgi:hypothetical protein